MRILNWEENLSPHFTLNEMVRVSVKEYVEENKKALTEETYNCLKDLCVNILEPIREKFGTVIIHSGFRCPEYNKLIGGSPTSQHMLGQAADFHIVSRCDIPTFKSDFEWIYKSSNIKFGQVIYELDSWIHISLGEPYREITKCREALVYENVNGKNQYRRISDNGMRLMSCPNCGGSGVVWVRDYVPF